MANSVTPADMTTTSKDGGYTHRVILDFLSCDPAAVTGTLGTAVSPLWDSGQANHKPVNTPSPILALEAHTRGSQQNQDKKSYPDLEEISSSLLFPMSRAVQVLQKPNPECAQWG